MSEDDLGKRVKKIEGDHAFIGPGPEGYENDKKAMKEQAGKDAGKMGKGIKKFIQKIKNTPDGYMGWLMRNREQEEEQIKKG